MDWHYWLAGAACAVVGVAAVVAALVRAQSTERFESGRLPEPVTLVILAVAGLALATAVIAAAAVIRAGTQIPVLLGLLAVAFQTGLDYADDMVWHSAISDVRGTGSFGLLGAVAGLALLFGGLLIVALHRSSDAPRTEAAEPVEPDPVGSAAEHQQ